MLEKTNPRRKDGILANELDQQVVLYSVENEVIHILNPTARAIWDLCDGKHSLQDIEHKVRTRFAVAEEHDVYADIQQTLQQFSAKGLLQDSN